jgi:hypothetical protein
MNMFWHETASDPPPAHVVVLGWWSPLHIGSVVRRGGDFWHKPGYYTAEKRTPPPWWAELPEPPLQDEKST